MRRLGIFVFYDPEGIVDDYVVFLLQSMRKYLDRLCIICNGYVNVDGKNKLIQCSREIWVRENAGYDAGAVKYALCKEIGLAEACIYDEIVVFNDTFYGPVIPLDDTFEKMSGKSDFWGFLGNVDNMSDCRNGVAYIPSFFYVMSHRLMNDVRWQNYWRDMNPYSWSFQETVTYYEKQLLKKVVELGYKWDIYIKHEVCGENQTALSEYKKLADILIKKYGFPFLKRKIISLNGDYKAGLDNNEIQAIEYIKENTDYDVKLIWKNLLRRYFLFDLMPNCTRIVSFENVFFTCTKSRIIFVLDLNNFFLESEYESLQQEIRAMKMADLCEVHCQEDYLSVINALINYDYVCYINDAFVREKTDVVYLMNWYAYVYSNILQSENIEGAVADIFEKNYDVGLFAMYNYDVGEDIWSLSEEDDHPYDDLISKLPNIPHTTEGYPPIVNQSVFWARSELLRLGLEAMIHSNASYDEYGACMAYIMPYVAQSRGYITSFMMSQRMLTGQLNFYRNTAKSFVEMENSCGRKIERYSEVRYLDLLEFCKEHRYIYVYGCGVIGKRVMKFLEKNKVKNEGYVVSDNQTSFIMGGGIKKLSDVKENPAEIGIIAAVSNAYREEITRQCATRGIKHIYYLSDQDPANRRKLRQEENLING